jgi:flagellar biosynthesis protein
MSVRRAVALKYDGVAAPRVVASGQGHVADRIAEKAREAGVAVREDAALVEILGHLQLGQEIPEDLYKAVAEVLVWAYGLDKSARSASQTPR